jgi:hypothetical protein
MYRWMKGTLVLCCSLAMFVGVASLSENRPSQAQLPPILTTNSNSIAPATAKVINLKLSEVLRVRIADLPSRLPAPGETAIFLGDVDITSQMQREGDEFVYKSELLPLH